MEVSHLPCRLCLTVTDFNVSLFDKYCRKTNMINKILVCLKLVVEETDHMQTICYKCAGSVERFYDFIAFVKKAQTKYCNSERHEPKRSSEPQPANLTRRHPTPYVREHAFDADYTFSSLEISHDEDNREAKASSPFFSYFAPPNTRPKPSPEPRMWKTPQLRSNGIQKSQKGRLERHSKTERPRQFSRDMFKSQSTNTSLESQAAEQTQPRSLDWKFTSDESIIKRIREKCFGPSEF